MKRNAYCAVWVVLDNSGELVKTFRYPKLEAAQDLVREKEAETGIRHYIRQLKCIVPISAKKQK